jgi:hypothetical protein
MPVLFKVLVSTRTVYRPLILLFCISTCSISCSLSFGQSRAAGGEQDDLPGCHVPSPTKKGIQHIAEPPELAVNNKPGNVC